MRIGIIDLGTNSVRFDIHQFSASGRVVQLHREKIMVRLGQDVFVRGSLNKNAIQRTLHAFLSFKKVGARFKVGKILAFGTSALREATDAQRILQAIQVKTGIEVRVISGQDEAKLIALGILSHEKLPKARFALVDIGGGSTEISICRGGRVLHSNSFPLGTARLQQLFLKKVPPTETSLRAMRSFIRNTLTQYFSAEGWPKVEMIVGSSGTIRAIARILKKSFDVSTIERGRLEELTEHMSPLSMAELQKIPGLEPKRTDMIVAGSVLFEECMRALGAKRAVASQFSLRDGMLEEERRLLGYGQGELSHLSLHLDDLHEKAKAFGKDGAHLTRTARLADQVYDGLAPVHHLGPRWKVYLHAAALLRDIGKSVSPANHHLHSYYILKNGDLPAMEEWEVDFLALLSRHHEGMKLEPKKIAFFRDPEKKAAFTKLLAMLMVVDSLDSGPDSHVRIRQVRILPKRAQVIFTGKHLTGLEGLKAESRKDFIKKSLRKVVTVERG